VSWSVSEGKVSLSTRTCLHALILGGGGEDLQQSVSKDVDAIDKVVREQTRGLYQPGIQKILLNSEVTGASVREAICEMALALAAVDSNDLLVIYFAGNGSKTKTGDLQLHASDVRDTIPWSAFAPLLARPCRTLVVLDCCNAGLAAGVTPPLKILREERKAGPFVVLAACSGSEVSLGTDDKGGLFTS